MLLVEWIRGRSAARENLRTAKHWPLVQLERPCRFVVARPSSHLLGTLDLNHRAHHHCCCHPCTVSPSDQSSVQCEYRPRHPSALSAAAADTPTPAARRATATTRVFGSQTAFHGTFAARTHTTHPSLSHCLRAHTTIPPILHLSAARRHHREYARPVASRRHLPAPFHPPTTHRPPRSQSTTPYPAVHQNTGSSQITAAYIYRRTAHLVLPPRGETAPSHQ
jgi:hypothetical protein